jgi:hypothetical protein
MSYVNQTDVEALSGSLSSEQADYLNGALGAAIDSYINRITDTKFGDTTTTDVYVDGNGTANLIIPTMHTITAVTHIDDDGTEDVVDAADWFAYPRGETDKYAIRSLNGEWDDGFQNYKVSGILGFSAIPADISLVATELAVNGLTTTNNYKSERVGDWSVTYSDMEQALSSDSQAILNSYRRLSRGV